MSNTTVPQNVKGKHSDLQYRETFATQEEAERAYKRACKRLLNPPVWHELTGPVSASFALVAQDGADARRLALVGDHFKIKMPGLPNPAGDGYDWVCVEAIDEKNATPQDDTETTSLRVRPCGQPGKERGGDTTHFFEESATSTFVIERNGNTVTSHYHGRNEVANVHTGNTLENLRNVGVAIGGFIGLSEAHWYALIKGFLQEEIGG